MEIAADGLKHRLRRLLPGGRHSGASEFHSRIRPNRGHASRACWSALCAVDVVTDIWAFGCVLYEMLTGKMTFRGDSMTDTLASVIPASTIAGDRRRAHRAG
jgi:serine/threonine protein kinase